MRRKKRSKQVAPTPAPESAAPSTLKRDVLWLVLAGALAFASAVPGGFVWLDHAQIEQAHYRIVDAEDWSRVWSETIEQFQGRRSGIVVDSGRDWRPIYALSVSLDWFLWDGRAWCYHLENILWHLAVVVGLYVLGNQLFGSSPEGRRAVFWATLLFAVHPTTVFSVTPIVCRNDTMCAAFATFALVALGHVAAESDGRAWRGRRVVGWIGVSAVLTLLAIGTKEFGFVVPALATVLFFPPLTVGQNPDRRRQRAVRLIGLGTLWACALAMIAYRATVVGATVSDAVYPTDSPLRNVAMSATLLWHYALRALIPHNVRFSDAWPVVQQIGVVELSAMVALVAVAGATVYGWLRNWPWAMALMWFAVWMFPASGIAPLRHFRAERYLYPASWGILLAVLMLLLPVAERAFAPYGRRATAILLSVAAAMFALKTSQENTHWWSDETLFRRAVAQDPHHVEAHIELSRLALERGEYGEAARLARIALHELNNPQYVAYGVPYYAHTWLGTALVRLGQPAEALKEFQQALRYMPNSPTGYSNLAMAEAALGNSASAREYLTRSLELDPRDNTTRHNLGLLYLQTGDVDACVKLLRAHVLSHPDDVPNVINFATALTMLGQYDQAEPLFARLVRSFSDNPIYRARWAWCQWNLGKTGDAERNLEIARTQAPDNPVVRTVEQLIRQHWTDQDNGAGE